MVEELYELLCRRASVRRLCQSDNFRPGVDIPTQTEMISAAMNEQPLIRVHERKRVL